MKQLGSSGDGEDLRAADPTGAQLRDTLQTTNETVGYGAFARGACPVGDSDLQRFAVAQAWVSARANVIRVLHPIVATNPAWDILLDLFICRFKQRPVVVSNLCSAANSPPTTALRWISTLEEANLISRVRDPDDGRRFLMSLTEAGLIKMREALDACSESDRKLGLGRLCSVKND